VRNPKSGAPGRGLIQWRGRDLASGAKNAKLASLRPQPLSRFFSRVTGGMIMPASRMPAWPSNPMYSGSTRPWYSKGHGCVLYLDQPVRV